MINQSMWVQAPELEIDKVLGVSPNGRLERRIVANLIDHLDTRGFRIHSLYDSEETAHFHDMPGDVKAAMELIFNLDEASLRFIKKLSADSGAWHGVLLILGNGIDIISDWNYSIGDGDGFDAAMQAFNTEDYA